MASKKGDGKEEFATMGQVKAMVRRKLRKQEEPHEEGLNIYPMMDMMTILLVFLVAQFATDAKQINQSEELQLPYSTSELAQQDALTILVSRNELLVADVRIIGLRDGLVDPAEKVGGSTGFNITKLLRELRDRRELQRQIDAARGQQFRGEVQIIADKRTPYRTITEVLYTLGQAEYKAIRFTVLRGVRDG